MFGIIVGLIGIYASTSPGLTILLYVVGGKRYVKYIEYLPIAIGVYQTIRYNLASVSSSQSRL